LDYQNHIVRNLVLFGKIVCRKEQKMSALPESTIYFEESIVDLEDWKLKQLASAGRSLVDGSRGLYAFIESGGRQNNHFLITIGSTRNVPLFTYDAAIISPCKSVRLLCRFIKEQ
jgi:hypothetical protein